MTTSIKGPGIYRAHRARAVYDGALHTQSWSLTVPSGTLIEDNAVIRIGRVEPRKCNFTRVLVDISGNLDGHATPASRTLVGTLGLVKSSDRDGNNLSFAASGSAATEDVDFFLLATSVPLADPGTVDEFGTAGDGAILSNGGFHIYNLAPGSSDARGYDANVMDVAISITEPSSTATTADVVLTVTLEYGGVVTAPASGAPYLYRNRYNTSGVSSV